MSAVTTDTFSSQQIALHSSDSALELNRKRTSDNIALKFPKKPCFERDTARAFAEKVNARFRQLAQSEPASSTNGSVRRNPRIVEALSDNELAELLHSLRSK